MSAFLLIFGVLIAVTARGRRASPGASFSAREWRLAAPAFAGLFSALVLAFYLAAKVTLS